ncbi:MAG: bifunctional phosphoribosyl-AMP cyclohydrolase/phosphoribosyl-ATP diphosphatase HisIE [Thermoplasmatota archaeon]
MSAPLPDFAKSPDGLVPCIAQDAATGEVLTLAYMSRESLALTRETGFVHYFSRSRNRIWKKGEESGNVQRVVSLALDCDGDALLARVEPTGPACHTGARSCFFTPVVGYAEAGLLELERVFEERAANPRTGSHTSRLLADENLRLKKVAEEAGELIMAAKDADPAKVQAEAADVVYHALAAAFAAGVTPRDVMRELAARRSK